MISNKTIEAYKKAVQNINKAVEKEIDSFDIDYDKVVQYFYIFVGDIKYECAVIKHANKYNYDIKIFTANDNIFYIANFKISEHTGKAMVYELKVLNI
jgi:S-ribosylhomocysteine lyase LuxS involved in autoinducer biosynthesis